MQCDDCQAALLDLALGELADDVATHARAHAADCERCQPDLARIETGLALARQLPDEAPSPALASRVLALRAGRRPPG